MLSTFQKHIEDMRNLSLCKICIKPFYEPFILPCGHTYCYSCLASWFGGAQGRKSKKSCPDCRAKVRAQPSPNYLLRDLVHMFIGRAELLPEDETVQEHQTAREEEAVLLAADKAGPGLFKGAFLGLNRLNLQRNWRQGILDPEDNVVRCPDCHWELEDGECGRCGFHEFDDSGSDYDSEDITGESIMLDDSEIDDEDEIDHEFGLSMAEPGFGYHIHDPSRIPSFSSEEEDDDDEDDDMNSLTTSNRPTYGDSDSEAGTESTMTMYNRHIGNEMDDGPPSSDGSIDSVGEYHSHGLEGRRDDQEDQSDAATNYDEMTEASDDDDTPVRHTRRTNIMRVVLSSDDEEDEAEEEDEHDESVATEHEGEEDEEDEDEEGEDEDGDGDVSDEEPNSERSVTEPANDYSDESEESDTSIRPPQPSARRRQHLHTQRARRNPQDSHSRSHGVQPWSSPPRYQYSQPPSRGSGFQHNRGNHGTSSRRYQPYNRPSPGRGIRVGGAHASYPM